MVTLLTWQATKFLSPLNKMHLSTRQLRLSTRIMSIYSIGQHKKEGCPIHPHCNGLYNPCYDPYGLKNGIRSVKGRLRSVNCIIAREGTYGLSVRTIYTVLLKALTRTMDTCLNFCILKSGAPNDGFLLNTLRAPFKATQSTFRSLEMHPLWNYKICICSVILGELESFRNY